MEGKFEPTPTPNPSSNWQTYDPHEPAGPSAPFSQPGPGPDRPLLKQVRRQGGKAFLLVIILLVLANLLSIAFQYGAASLGLTAGMNTFLSSYFPCLLADLICIGLGVLLFRSAPKEPEYEIPAPKTDSNFTVWAILGCLGAATTGAALFSQFYLFLELAGIHIQIPNISLLTGDWISSLLTILYVCVLGPICEEILFRGILLKGLKPYGSMTAIIVSSFAFTLFHGNPVQFATPLFVGLLLGYLTVKTRSLFPAMAAHILNNTLQTLPTLLGDSDSLVVVFCSGAVMVVGSISLIVFLLRYSKGFSQLYREEEQTGFSPWKKIGSVCRSPWFILIILIYLALTVLFCISYISF